MRIFIERDNSTQEKTFTGTGSELLSELGINPETVLLLKNKTLVTEDVKLDDHDDIQILTVISGG